MPSWNDCPFWKHTLGRKLSQGNPQRAGQCNHLAPTVAAMQWHSFNPGFQPKINSTLLNRSPARQNTFFPLLQNKGLTIPPPARHHTMGRFYCWREAMEPRITNRKSTTFFGRRFTRREISDIQETIALLPGNSRSELAKTLCDHLHGFTLIAMTRRLTRSGNDLLAEEGEEGKQRQTINFNHALAIVAATMEELLHGPKHLRHANPDTP